MKLVALRSLLLSALITTSAFAASESPHRIGSRMPHFHVADYTVQNFTQVIDHFDANAKDTFQQRYVFDSSYAKAGKAAPVVLYVCGEGNCMEGELSEDGFPAILAKSLGAHLVALEHRYYGTSQPFTQFTTENMKFLSIEQAIEDLATFQKWLSSTQQLTGKWVAIGGSYPADLAAIYRLKHPELASGAIASSACAKFTNGTIDSDKVAAQTAGASCVAKYRTNVLLPIQMAMGNPTAMAPLKEMFDASDITDDLDFLGTLSGMAIFDVQELGSKGFCASLEAADPQASFAALMKKFVGDWGTRLIDWSYTGTATTDARKFQGSLGFRQWVYQGCTQEGVFSAAVMEANPDATQSLSSQLTDVLPAKYCSIFFGINTPPAIDEMNQKYYEPLLKPTTSNILFISGSNDPACFPYSIAKENGNATNPNTAAFTVQGGSHCEDLNPPTATDSDSLKAARVLEVQLAKKWTAAKKIKSRK